MAETQRNREGRAIKKLRDFLIDGRVLFGIYTLTTIVASVHKFLMDKHHNFLIFKIS